MTGFRWFQVPSDGFRWFQIVPCFSKYGTSLYFAQTSETSLEGARKNSYFYSHTLQNTHYGVSLQKKILRLIIFTNKQRVYL